MDEETSDYVCRMDDQKPVFVCKRHDSSEWWLLLWAALLTGPQLLYYTLRQHDPELRTARWRFRKDAALMGGLLVAVIFSFVVPFLPKKVSGGADLTVFLLGVYAIFREISMHRKKLVKDYDADQAYERADTICRHMFQKVSDNDPGPVTQARDEPGTVTGVLNDILAFRLGAAHLIHKTNWNKHAQMLTMRAKLDEMYAVEQYGVRYHLVALYQVLKNQCRAPYNIRGLRDFDFIGAARKVLELSDSGATDAILEYALKEAGVDAWEAARKAACDTEYQISRFELAQGSGLVAWAKSSRSGLDDVAKAVDAYEKGQAAARARTDVHGEKSQMILDLQEPAYVYNACVLCIELIVLSDYLCCTRDKGQPLAHTIIDEFFAKNGLWEHVKKKAERDPRPPEMLMNLWNVWIASSVAYTPLLVLLAFCKQRGHLSDDVACKVIADCNRAELVARHQFWSLPAGDTTLLENDGMCPADALWPFSDELGIGIGVGDCHVGDYRTNRVKAVGRQAFQHARARQPVGEGAAEASMSAHPAMLSAAMCTETQVGDEVKPEKMLEESLDVLITQGLPWMGYWPKGYYSLSPMDQRNIACAVEAASKGMEGMEVGWLLYSEQEWDAAKKLLDIAYRHTSHTFRFQHI